MKKINRKGFTLIELLAVIVVLAIVLVVTIPSVLRSVDSAREKSLENAANSVADWMTRQYELSELEVTGITTDTVDKNFKDLYINIKNSESHDPTRFSILLYTSDVVNASQAEAKEDALLKAAGIGGGTADVTGEAWLNGDRICIRLTPTTGDGTNSRFKGLSAKTSAGCE